MKIKNVLLSIVISMAVIGVITMGSSLAQQETPPNIKVSLALKDSRLPNTLVYLLDDSIKMVLTIKNNGGQEFTSGGFSTLPFHLYLVFTGPDGRTITANKLAIPLKEDAPPPQTILDNDELVQVEAVENLGAGWVLSITIPDGHAFYTLSKAGYYNVRAVIPMRTYKTVDYPGPPGYSRLANSSKKWSGALYSNAERFALLADADRDGYYVPEGWPPGAPADCNDNDANEKPGQIWYKDADNDGYSDGATITSCTKPQGYKVASELIALSGDCEDNDANRNPGKTEIPCNGIDDDCNPATPDVPAPTLASPVDGATNVSITPTLSWNASICVGASYRIQIATDQSFSPSSVVIDQSSIAGTSFAVSTPLINNRIYYWHVNAKNAGTTSDWSTPWRFTTALGPLDHITISPASATITPGGSQVYKATGYDQYNNSLGDVTAATTFSITPDGSCTGAKCTATILGLHTVTGNDSNKTDTASLNVVQYNFSGFLSPILNHPGMNKTNAGNTIPLKWQLTDTNGVGISDGSSFVNFTSVKVDCTSSKPTAPPVTDTLGILYNGNGYWQYNWKTPKTAGTCYQITIKLLDGTEHKADFSLTK